MKVLTERRYQQILNLLDDKQTVTLQSLVEQLKVSESTIRRDLSHLEDKKKLTRVHGGAKKNFVLDSEQNIEEKSFKNIQEKNKIGEYAASLVKNNDSIYLDAGTTAYAMIPYLKNKDIEVITNGIQSANALTDIGIDTIFLGGKIKQTTKAVIGSVAVKQLEQYRFSKVFLGINGVDIKYGLTTPDIEEATIKQTAADVGYDVYFLADSSKFEKITFSQVAPLEKQIIITNKFSDQSIEKYKNISTIEEVS